MSFAAVLRSYATLKDPSKRLPSSVHLTSNDTALAIFDKYQKAKYHFLVLPRWPFPADDAESSSPGGQDQSNVESRPVKRARRRRSNSSSDYSASDTADVTDHGSPPRVATSTDAHTPTLGLSKLDSIDALMCRASPTARRQVLKALREMGEEVADMIKDEMIKSEGFEWGVEMGFHIIPSILHLHLHVISSDLVSDRLTSKKHYNSFKPNESYFLKLEDVEKMLDWDQRDVDREIRSLMSRAKSVLESPLTCHQCGQPAPNMPAMKQHLEQEWRKAGKGKSKLAGA